MVNVPTGVWIDEEGRMVRPNEPAYSSEIRYLELYVNGDDYVAAIRDWVEKGSESEYVLSAEELQAKQEPRSAEQELADANFKLAVYFHKQQNEELADRYFAQAQELRPDSWNYHRQDWSFTPKEAMGNWMKKYNALGEEPYYPALDLPAAGGE